MTDEQFSYIARLLTLIAKGVGVMIAHTCGLEALEKYSADVDKFTNEN